MVEILIEAIIHSFQMLSYFLVLYMTESAIATFLFKKIVLCRISKYEGQMIVTEKNIHNRLESMKIKKIDYKDKETIKPYVEKLIKNIPEDCLQVLANNLATLNVKKKKSMSSMVIVGQFDGKKNLLTYAKEESIGHELLHMASSITNSNDESICIGFFHKKKMNMMGKGLDEGYTELLASRIFNKNNKVTAYHEVVHIAKLIELFFEDSKDMQRLYFNGNLPALVSYLETFAYRNEIIKLILDIDSVCIMTSLFPNPIGIIKSVHIKMKLYRMFAQKCNDPYKLEYFKFVLKQDKFIDILLKGRIFKLCGEDITKSNHTIFDKSK